jgi:ketosteroid isomerase-like protein
MLGRGVWDARIETVRGFADAITERDVDAGLALCHEAVEFFSLMAQLEARTYRGHSGITRYFEDVAATWDESTHMCRKGSGIPLTERAAHVWEFNDEKLWRARLYRDPAEALAVLSGRIPPLRPRTADQG